MQKYSGKFALAKIDSEIVPPIPRRVALKLATSWPVANFDLHFPAFCRIIEAEYLLRGN